MSRSEEVTKIFAQLINTATPTETLFFSLWRLLQIWADARNLIRNRRPKKDTDFIEFMRNELFLRTQAVKEHAQKARRFYTGQLLITRKMITMERERHVTKQWLTTTVDPGRLQVMGSMRTLFKVQNLVKVVMRNVAVMEERINQVENFLKFGVKEDYPAFREVEPLITEYLLQYLVLQKIRVLQYETEKKNRERFIGWLNNFTSS